MTPLVTIIGLLTLVAVGLVSWELIKGGSRLAFAVLCLALIELIRLLPLGR